MTVSSRNPLPEGRWQTSRGMWGAVLFLVVYLLVEVASLLAQSRFPGPVWLPGIGLSFAILLAYGPTAAPLVALAALLDTLLIQPRPQPQILGVVQSLGQVIFLTAAAIWLRRRGQQRPQVESLSQAGEIVLGASAAGILLAAIDVLTASGVDQPSQAFLIGPWLEAAYVNIASLLAIGLFCLVVVLPALEKLKLPAEPLKLPAPGNKATRIQAVQWGLLAIALVSELYFLASQNHLFHYLTLIPLLWIALDHGIGKALLAVNLLQIGVLLITGQMALAPSTQHDLLAMFLAQSISVVIIGASTVQRRQAAQDLRERESLYRTLLSSMEDGVTLLDPAGKIKEIYGRWEAAYRIPAPHAAGAGLSEIFEGQTGVHQAAFKRARQGETISYDFALDDQNKQPGWVHQTLLPVRDAEGQISAVLMVGRDITRLKLAQYTTQTNEERLRLALEGIDEAVWDWDMETNQVYRSPRWAEMLGYKPDEITPAPEAWQELIHPDDLIISDQALQDHLEGRSPAYVCEYRIRTRQGDWRWVLDRGKVARWDSAGRPLRMTGTHTDINAQKAAEAELLNRQREQRFLNEITQSALKATSLEAMLQLLADRLGELLTADGAYITLWNEAANAPVGVASYGPRKATYPGTRPMPGEISMTASVLEAGKVLVAEDVHNSPYISRRIASLFPERSMIGLPLIADGRKLGAALISFNQVRRFTAQEIALAEQTAVQLSLAVARVISLEAEQKRSAQFLRANTFITALVRVAARLESAANPDAVMETLGAELRAIGLNCLVALPAANRPEMTVRYHSASRRLAGLQKLDPALTITDYRFIPGRFPYYQQVIEQRQPLFVSDTQELLSIAIPELTPRLVRALSRALKINPQTTSLLLPLTAEEKVLGMMWLWGQQLSEPDLPAASLFASQVAITLESAELFHQTVDAAGRRDVLYRASQAIGATLDLDRLYEAIHKAAAQLMPAEVFVVSLLDQASQEIEAVYLVDQGIRYPARRIPPGSGFSSQVIARGVSIRLGNYNAEINGSAAHFGDEQKTVRSVLAVPLRRQDGSFFGMIAAESYLAEAYDSEDQTLLELLSAYAAIAIDNARLFAEARRLAITDPLTGLINRRHFFELANRELKRSRRYNYSLSVIMLDVDNFKRVNDSYGHQVGDVVLRQVAQRCRACVREVDLICRYGGEEFLSMLLETDLAGCIQVAERLRERIADLPIEVDGIQVFVTASIGVAELDAENGDVDTLLRYADQALYHSKARGRNQVTAWTPSLQGEISN
jgi:diguanylate cyclase (GGDEF)-like protein/PAS domain S-box-containing protein